MQSYDKVQNKLTKYTFDTNACHVGERFNHLILPSTPSLSFRLPPRLLRKSIPTVYGRHTVHSSFGRRLRIRDRLPFLALG